MQTKFWDPLVSSTDTDLEILRTPKVENHYVYFEN